MYSDPERSPDSNGIDINKRYHRTRKKDANLPQVTKLHYFFEVGRSKKWPGRTKSKVERYTKDG